MNKQYDIKPKAHIFSPHTIGAGDTFFSHFVATFIATQNIALSGRIAVDKTSAFLRTL